MTLFWVVAALTFADDRIAKLAAQAALALGGRVVLWPAVLELRLTRNTGIALGFFSGVPLVITVLPLLAMVIGWLLLRRYRATRFVLAAAALVTGGFLGNFADRLWYGYVLDMIYFPWMPWYICNAADIAITAGVALLAVSLLLRPNDWTLKTEGKPHGPNNADRTA
jgi:signal peptidase II